MLKEEARIVNDMHDGELVEAYEIGHLGDFDLDANGPQSSSMSSTGCQRALADLATLPASLRGPADEDVASESSLRNTSESSLRNTASNFAKQVFQGCLDDLDAVFNTSHSFLVTERDSKDFEELCKMNYNKSLEETNLDPVDVDDVLETAAPTGWFEVSGGKIGNIWARLPKTDPAKMQCAATRNNKLKADIRAKWAKEQFSYILESKTHEESYSKVDTTKGDFHTFGGLVIELGGWQWPPAIEGAKLHFIKAMRLGGSWVCLDEMSNLLLALRLKPSFQEVLTTKWTRFTKLHNEAMNSSGLGNEETQAAETEAAETKAAETKAAETKTAETKAQRTTPKNKAKATPKKGTKPDDQKTSDPQQLLDDQMSARLAAEVKELNLDCQKIKKGMQVAQISAATLLDQFAKDPDYAWGKNNSEADEALQAALQAVVDGKTSFESEYLMVPFAAVQKSFGNDYLKVELTAFKSKKPAVDKLTELLQTLLRMHASRRTKST